MIIFKTTIAPWFNVDSIISDMDYCSCVKLNYLRSSNFSSWCVERIFEQMRFKSRLERLEYIKTL